MASFGMISLPSGLASISARLDDTPQVRGAVDIGRMEAKKREAEAFEARIRGLMARYPKTMECLARCEDTLASAIDRHAALVIGSAYRSADRR